MCHAFLTSATFYQWLFQIDQAIAADVRAEGCRYCGGALHVADYPRKPRCIRGVLDVSYQTRLSFCCANEGCRRRTTPPSVRFLGRKVYLGTVVILVTALEHGLGGAGRAGLIESLDLWPQTIARWRQWWLNTFSASPCWQWARGRWMPPPANAALPGALLGRLAGRDLEHRLCLLLRLLTPLTTGSWTGWVRVAVDPQKM